MSQSAVASFTHVENNLSFYPKTNKSVVENLRIHNTEAEVERLNGLHRMETLINSALCWPMDEVNEILSFQEDTTVRVLSVGSGGGRWAVEMAKLFPHADVLGIDADPRRPSDTPSNCRFEAIDILNGDLTHLQGMFEVVHCARAGGMARYYNAFLKRLAKLVKPGGILLHVSGDINAYDENGNIIKPASPGQEPGTGSWWARFWIEFQNHVPLLRDIIIAGFSEKVAHWLQEDPSLDALKAKHVYLPLGWPGTERDGLANGEEIGRLLGQSAIQRARTLEPMLLAHGMSPEGLYHCLREAEAEILHQTLPIYTCWHFFAARSKRAREVCS